MTRLVDTIETRAALRTRLSDLRRELAELAASLDTVDHDAARAVGMARSDLFSAWSYLRRPADESSRPAKPKKTHKRIPADWPVQPLMSAEGAKDAATCGHCGLMWDDGISTSWTPTPSGRCPFESFHCE